MYVCSHHISAIQSLSDCGVHLSLPPSPLSLLSPHSPSLSSSYSLYIDGFTVAVGRALKPTGSRIVNDIFGFRSNTDILIVLDNSALNREDVPEYQFEVIAMDTLHQSSNATVTIKVTDINDNAPAISKAIVQPGINYIINDQG